MKGMMWLLLIITVLLTACGGSQSLAQPVPAMITEPTKIAVVPTQALEPAPTTAPAATQPVVIPVTGEKSPEVALEAQVNSYDGLNLRAGPGLNYRVLAVLFDGQKVRLEGRSLDSTWVVVRTSDGTAGWAYRDYLKTDAQLAALPMLQAAGGPGTGSPVVAQPEPAPTAQPSLPGKYTLYMTISANQAVVSVTKMPANSEVTITLSVRGGQSITAASGETDENGAASFAFDMPRFWPDGSRITQTSLLLTATSADGSVTRTASISYDAGE